MKGMGTALTNGKLVLYTKANGELIKHMVKVLFGIRVVIFILANSFRIKHMDMVFIYIKMVRIMKGSGNKMPKKAKVRKYGKMVHNMKVVTKMGARMDMVFTHGATAASFKEAGKAIRSLASAFINGMMVVCMKGTS